MNINGQAWIVMDDVLIKKVKNEPFDGLLGEQRLLRRGDTVLLDGIVAHSRPIGWRYTNRPGGPLLLDGPDNRLSAEYVAEHGYVETPVYAGEPVRVGGGRR